MGSNVTLTKKGKIVFGSLFLVLLVPVVVYGVSLSQKRELLLPVLPENKVLSAQDTQTQGILEKVGTLMVLPHDEQPQIAKVSDASKLQNRELFKNAKSGDFVLIFQNSGKVIIYRPGENKIVDVLTVTVRQESPMIQDENLTPTVSPSPSDLVSPQIKEKASEGASLNEEDL